MLPEVDAEFAKAFGIASGSLDELRAEIDVEPEARAQAQDRRDGQGAGACGAARRSAEFALPQSLVELEAQNMARADGGRAEAAGHEARGHQAHAGHVPRAGRRARRARSGPGRGGARARLQAKPEQVKALVEEAAQTYEQPDAVVRWHYEKPERLNEFEALAVERNVVDWVLRGRRSSTSRRRSPS